MALLYGFLFLSFLRIGSTGVRRIYGSYFGVQTEIVERKKLLTHNEVLDGISLATILPGPVAINVVAYVGYNCAGAGCFGQRSRRYPSRFHADVALSAAYFRWGQIPAVNKLFLGFIPAVTAIIVHAAWGMARKAIFGLPEFAIAVIACLLLLYKGGFYITLIIIVSAALIGWLSFAPFSNLSAEPPKTSRHEKDIG